MHCGQASPCLPLALLRDGPLETGSGRTWSLWRPDVTRKTGWCVPRRLKHVDLCFDASDGAVNDDEDFNEDQVGAIELDG